MKWWSSKPYSVTARTLDSISYLTTKSTLLTSISRFLDYPVPPPPTAPPTVALNIVSPLSITSLPTSSPVADHRQTGLCSHPPVASLRHLSLRPAPRARLRCRVPRPFDPPCRPWPVPRSLLVPGGSSAVGTSVSLCHCLYTLPCESSSLVIFGVRFISFSSRSFRVQRQWSRAPPLTGSRKTQSLPSPAKWPCWRRAVHLDTTPRPPYMSSLSHPL